MEKIPTLEEWSPLKFNGELKYNKTDMIEFAKMHVEMALKEAIEKAKVQMGDNCVVNQISIQPRSIVDTAVIKVNSASILNSYSLDNIK